MNKKAGYHCQLLSDVNQFGNYFPQRHERYTCSLYTCMQHNQSTNLDTVNILSSYSVHLLVGYVEAIHRV